MRKAIIAAIVATALFAVGAFAASFAVEAEDVASGSDPVATCADDVDIEFDDVYVEATKSWEIQKITVTLNDTTTGGTLPSCDGALATLILQNDGNSSDTTTDIVYEATETVPTVPGDDNADVVEFVPACDGGDTDCTQDAPVSGSWTHLPVASVWNAAVLIDGNEIDGVDIEAGA